MALKSSGSLRLLPIAPFPSRQRGSFLCEVDGEGGAEVHAQLGASCECLANGLYIEKVFLYSRSIWQAGLAFIWLVSFLCYQCLFLINKKIILLLPF